MPAYAQTEAGRRHIKALGGVITETRDGVQVDFPEQAEAPAGPRADAREVEAAVERAREYGTRCLPVWRERGTGWYVAESREEHPGYVYLCHIDTVTGSPVSCECVASEVCHHLGAAIADWREASGYEANGAVATAVWEEALAMARANAPKEAREEQWT